MFSQHHLKSPVGPHHIRIKFKPALSPQALQDPAPALLFHLISKLFCSTHIALPAVLNTPKSFLPQGLGTISSLSETSSLTSQVSLQMSPTQRGLPDYSETPVNSLTHFVPFQTFITPVTLDIHLSATCFPSPHWAGNSTTLFHTFFLQGPYTRRDTIDQVAGLELGHLKSQGPSAPSFLPTPNPVPGLPPPTPLFLQPQSRHLSWAPAFSS